MERTVRFWFRYIATLPRAILIWRSVNNLSMEEVEEELRRDYHL